MLCPNLLCQTSEPGERRVGQTHCLWPLKGRPRAAPKGEHKRLSDPSRQSHSASAAKRLQHSEGAHAQAPWPLACASAGLALLRRSVPLETRPP
eukprot:11316897-Alexandrium_andersonii.AAC.1